MRHLLVLCTSLFLFNFSILQSGQLVYVYHTGSSSDSTAALSFKSLLEPMGYTTTLLGTNDILATDLSQFDAILIGNGTGMLDVWADSSVLTSVVTAIDNSNKPIIGLGEGGYAFFGKLSLNIGWYQGAHGYDSALVAVAPHHAVFTTPNEIVIPQDSVIQLYDTANSVIEIFLPSVPSDVTVLGVLSWDRHYYRLVQEKIRYFLWGFSDSPGNMTPTGKQIFLNVIDYMIKSYPSKSVVFIYAEDNQWGLDFASLLQTHGINPTLLSMNNVSIYDFSSTNLIIFDSRKDIDYQWPDNSVTTPITNSGKPVLGIGLGGAAIFHGMGLSINFGNSWTGEDTAGTTPEYTSIFCANSSMPIFKSPLSIDIPPNSIIALYNRTGYLAVYQPYINPAAVCIGRQANDLSHYEIASEGIHYLWGFTNSPRDMTQTGKDLFYNIVVAMSNQIITGINKPTTHDNTLPREYRLSQNYPNPFNPSTTIEYSIPKTTYVSLKIFNVLGQEITSLVNTVQAAGVYRVEWQADGLSSGVYLYKFQAGSFSQTRKLLLVR
jgi:hypothetical protein